MKYRCGVAEIEQVLDRLNADIGIVPMERRSNNLNQDVDLRFGHLWPDLGELSDLWHQVP
jgi:hypothetical protein